MTVTSRFVEGQGRWGDRVEAGDGNQEEGQAGEQGNSRACAGLTLSGVYWEVSDHAVIRPWRGTEFPQ